MPTPRERLLKNPRPRLDRDRLRELSNATVHRGVRWTWGAAVRTRTRLPRRGYVPGLLSIVVPAYNVEHYIDECLASLREQSYRLVEILVVDDGSPDRSAEIARSHARRDPRVRVVTRPNGGLSAARNTGVEAARGEFLTFVDSDDVVRPDAYRRVIESLKASGSDFAVTSYDRLVGSEHQAAARWIGAAHSVERPACTLEEFPDIQVNAVAWSKVYRRSFYDEAGLEFPTGVLYEDQPVSAAAYAKARTFDVLPFVCVSWRIRGDRSSISQQAWTAPNLRAQIVATASSLEILEEAGRVDAAEQRAIQLMAHNLPVFAKHALGTDEEYWQLLREAVDDLRRRIKTPMFVAQVPAEHKVLNELILRDRRQEAQEFIAAQGLDHKRFRTVVTETGVRCELPVAEGAVPDEYLLLAEGQLDPQHRVVRAEWVGDELRVEGWAYLRNVDLAEHPVRIDLALVDVDGRSVPFSTETFVEHRVSDVAQHWWCDYTQGGFRATLDRSAVPDGDACWRLELTIEAGGVRRTTRLHNLVATALAGIQTVLPEPGRALSLDRDSDGRLQLDVRTHEVAAVSQSLAEDGARAVVEFRAPSAKGLVLAPSSDPDDTAATGTVTPAGDGLWRGEVALPRPRSSRRRHVRSVHFGMLVVDDAGERVPLLSAPRVAEDRSEQGGRLSLVDLRPDRTGLLQARQRDYLAEITDVRLHEEEVEVHLRTVGLAVDTLVPLIASSVRTVPGSLTAEPGGRAVLRFPLTTTLWGVEDLVLPPGRYYLQLESRQLDQPLRPVLTLEALRGIPVDELQSRARVRLEAGPGRLHSLGVAVMPPLREDERGPRNQRILREQSRVEEADLDAVFLRSLYGEVVNCNPLALHEGLHARRSPLQLLWSVADRSVPVPEGGTGLVEGTREWHDAIARARFQMVNVHQLSAFEKPRGQKIIQTMHGYPFKVMGHEWWAKGSFPPAQVASYDSRAREWDYFVSPATYATPLLSKAFLEPAGATPEILEIGYPRNDVLLSAERGAEVRRRVRELLGIRPDQTAVLYAPTFRDYLSADDMRAEMVDFFDVRAAARRLGPGFVFLMRGHAFNARAKQRYDETDAVIDVTDYPDINGLCHASDAAVLDYSSLRFDYALTDKPMIFFTPDLEQYNAARGGILDFRDTAPGPVVSQTREVVERLKRLETVDERHRAARKRFRETYCDLEDGHATDRLIAAVFTPEEAGPGDRGEAVSG